MVAWEAVVGTTSDTGRSSAALRSVFTPLLASVNLWVFPTFAGFVERPSEVSRVFSFSFSADAVVRGTEVLADKVEVLEAAEYPPVRRLLASVFVSVELCVLSNFVEFSELSSEISDALGSTNALVRGREFRFAPVGGFSVPLVVVWSD